MNERSPEFLAIERKLDRPTLPRRLIARSRLVEELDRNRHRRLTLMSAPAGYGKTTLALQWLASDSFPAAWVSLDAAERNPLRFLRILVTALSRCSDCEFRQTKALLASGISPPWQHAIEVFLGEFTANRERLVLVIEDYHFVDDPEVHALLEHLLEAAPASLSLVVLTRVDPPWPLARWRVRGWLSELRARDLCFTLEETSEFFADVWGLALSPTSVEVVQRRTEGWVAGLRLAHLSLSEASDPDRSAANLSGADSPIADYLVQEALQHQSSDLVEFLAASALLDRFSAPLMNQILADTMPPQKVRQILSDLEHRNLFLVSLDSRHEWFRWHHLFRDLLRIHLDERISTAVQPRMQRDAAVWFAKNGLIGEALQYYIAAGELDAAAELVGENLHAVIEEDLSRRLLSGWLDLFPAHTRQDRLPLLVAEAYTQTHRFDHVGLEKTLRQLERLQSDPSRKHSLQSDSLLKADIEGLWSNLRFWQGDARQSLDRSIRGLQYAPKVGSTPWVMCTVYRSGALALCGQLNDAMQLLDEALADAGPRSPHAAELLVTAAVLNLYALELDSCRDIAHQVLDLNERVPIPEFWLGYAYHLIGIVAYEENRLDEAEAAFRSVENLQYVVATRLYQDALLGSALVAMARNEPEKAKSCCSAAFDYCVEIGDRRSLHIVRSFELCAGMHASRSMGGLDEPPRSDDHQSFWLEAPTVSWAKHLSAHPDAMERAKAPAFVNDAIARMKHFHNERQAFTLEILRCVVMDEKGEHESALESFVELIRRGVGKGIVRSFVDCGPRVKRLLDELSRREPGDEYVESLRESFDNDRRAGRAAAGPGQSLTHRELETLRLLAWRMTNKEIAARLSVSPAAVKKRLENIYSKLDAHDRRAAVAEAVRQGLIRPAPR